MANAFIHDTAFQDAPLDGPANATESPHGIDGAQMMLVSFLHRQAAIQRNAETGAEQRLLDVVRRQGVAGEQDVDVAGANQLADMLDAAGMDHGGTEDGEDFLAGRLGTLHRRGNLAHGDTLGLFAGNRTGHELEQVRSCHRLRREDAQTLATDDEMIAETHLRHGNAASGRALGIDEDAAVHLLILHVNPFAAKPYLCAVIGGAVEVLGEGAIHIGGHGLTIANGDGRGPVIMDGVEDFAEFFAAVGADFDARMAGVGLPLADTNVLDDVGTAVHEDFIEYLGQQQRIDNVPLDFDFLDESLLARWGRDHNSLHVPG